MPKKSDLQLTIADLVVLSLLAESPMHGYQVNAELHRREVKDWAGISRPQIYYSLKKLASLKFIRPTVGESDPLGPEKQTFTPTPSGLAELSKSLEREEWATQRPPSSFLTWLVLSIHAKPATVRKVFDKRAKFLRTQIEKETETLKAIKSDIGPTIPIAAAVVELAIQQFEIEFDWLEKTRDKLK